MSAPNSKPTEAAEIDLDLGHEIVKAWRGSESGAAALPGLIAMAEGLEVEVDLLADVLAMGAAIGSAATVAVARSAPPTPDEVTLARGVLAWIRTRYEDLGDPDGWEVDEYRGWRIYAHGCEIYFDDEFEARAALKACRESKRLADHTIQRQRDHGTGRDWEHLARVMASDLANDAGCTVDQMLAAYEEGE